MAPGEGIVLRDVTAKMAEINLTDEVLLSLPVKDLNSVLRGFSAEKKDETKQRKKTLKNRGYAKQCREKRVRQIEALDQETQQLRDDIDHLTRENNKLKRERVEAREKYDFLQKLLTTGWPVWVISSAEQVVVVGIEEEENPVFEILSSDTIEVNRGRLRLQTT